MASNRITLSQGYFDSRYVNVTGDTITGSLTVPTIIGGTGTTSDLTLQTTSGVGATGADMHFLVGNNGATEAMTILNNGNVGIGTTAPGAKLVIDNGTNNARLNIGTLGSLDPTYGIALGTTSGSNAGTIYLQPSSGSVTLWDGTTANYYLNLYNAGTQAVQIASNGVSFFNGGNVGIGTTSPTNLLSLGGNAARIFWLERHTTADTAGNTLTITAGGATAGATNKAGGALILQGGLSTGSAESGVTIQGCVAGASGTADRTQTTMVQVLGNKIGFYGQTATAQQTGVAVTAEAIHAALVSLGLITA